MTHTNLKKELDNELNQYRKEGILDPAFKRKKLILYTIRTFSAFLLFYFLWDKSWIMWVLYIYIPINLFSLFTIVGSSYFLNKKIKNTYKTIEHLKNTIEEVEEYQDEI